MAKLVAVRGSGRIVMRPVNSTVPAELIAEVHRISGLTGEDEAMAEIASDGGSDFAGVMATSIADVGSGLFPPIPDPGIPHFYVSKKGNDANDGRTWGSAKATLEAALVALAAVTGLQKPYWGTNSGVIDMAYGVWNTDGNIQIPYGVLLRGAGTGNTTLKLNAGRNCNVIQTAAWGKTGINDIDDYIKIEQLTIDGNAANQTATVYESVVTSTVTLSTVTPGTVNVTSTTGMPTSGMLWIGNTRCSYTGTTSTSFTGVLKIKGESDTIYPLALVMPFDMQGHGIAIQATRCIFEDVTINACIGSGFAVQSSGSSSPGIAYENKFIRCRSGGNNRYGWEINEGATDGHIVESSGGLSKMGTLILKSVNWHVTDFHPVGIPAQDGKSATRGLITICAGMQYFSGLYLDTAMHSGIVIDTQKRQIPVYSLDIDATSLYGSAAGGRSPIIQIVGGFSTYAGAKVSGVKARVRHDDGSCGYVLTNGAQQITTVSVGAQNWTTQTKAQILDVTPLPPNGGSVSVLGTLSYTGTQVTETTCEAAAIGATSLTCARLGNLDSSGVVTVAFLPSQKTGMRVQYTGITMNGNKAVLTGIPTSGAGSITAAIPGGAYVAQHYLTGISGSAATSVPDGSVGAADNIANWTIENFELRYEVNGNLAAGAVDVIALAATGPNYVNAIDALAGGTRQYRVDGLGVPKSAVGTWTLGQSGSAFYGGYRQNSGTSALNDSLTSYEVFLDAGTWNLDLVGFKGADGAIVTPSLVSGRGRVVAISGTQDQYAASGAAAFDTFTGIDVKVSGLYSLIVKATGKNASSSGYRVRFSGGILTRTA
jgi:hypothetical protein